MRAGKIRTESLVREYCSSETINSPVSSFLCLGAMVAASCGGVVGVLLGECRREKGQQGKFGWGAGVGGAYVTAAKIWRACPAPRRSDARLWALPWASTLIIFGEPQHFQRLHTQCTRHAL